MAGSGNDDGYGDREWEGLDNTYKSFHFDLISNNAIFSFYLCGESKKIKDQETVVVVFCSGRLAIDIL